MKKTIYLLTLLLITSFGCSDDDSAPLPIFIPDLVSCSEPNSLQADNITTTEARLRWNPNGSSADYYQVELGSNGFTQGSGTVLNSNESSLDVTGLTADTAYDFYVRKNCGGDEFSDWAGPHSFVTDAN